MFIPQLGGITSRKQIPCFRLFLFKDRSKEQESQEEPTVPRKQDTKHFRDETKLQAEAGWITTQSKQQ
jgi:hypothetical protein